MKPKSLILLGVSGAFGLIAAALLTKAIGQNKTGGNEVEMRTVIVALEDMDIHKALTEENCRTEEWPANIMPPGVSTTMEQIANKRLNVRVAKGAPIFVRDLVDQHSPNSLAIPADKKVVGIRVPAEDHIAGLLQPGHQVDVIGIFNARDRPSFSRTFLRGIKVYAINNKTSPDNKEGIKVDESDITVSLLVDEKESEKLTLVQRVAKIKLAVRGFGEEKFDNTENPMSSSAESMVTLSDITNEVPDRNNAIGFGNLLKDFTAITRKAIPADTFATKGASKLQSNFEEPFRIKVVAGDQVTEYILRQDSLPQINATTSTSLPPASGFPNLGNPESSGKTLQSLAGEGETASESEKLEF